MPSSSNTLLTAFERRHGPLHAIVVASIEQWRWKRQLAAIVKKPTRARFSQLRVIHAWIVAASSESTSAKDLAVLRLAWQRASNALMAIADIDERVWLANNRLSAL